MTYQYRAVLLAFALHLVYLTTCCYARDFDNPKELLDICLKGRYHKTKPGPQDELFGQCLPWKDRSCCTKNVTEEFHISEEWYGLSWHHCGVELSPKCYEHFMQDLCFYECSPNTGPWFVDVNMTIRDEKFYHVPLCRSECDAWWEGCKDDYTCLKNWGLDFNWINGTNECPPEQPCLKFKELYESAEEFCETVWDFSFDVVDDEKPCMKLWFEGENPNRVVAEWMVDQLGGGQKQSSTFIITILLTISVILYFNLQYLGTQ